MLSNSPGSWFQSLGGDVVLVKVGNLCECFRRPAARSSRQKRKPYNESTIMRYFKTAPRDATGIPHGIPNVRDRK